MHVLAEAEAHSHSSSPPVPYFVRFAEAVWYLRDFFLVLVLVLVFDRDRQKKTSRFFHAVLVMMAEVLEAV